MIPGVGYQNTIIYHQTGHFLTHRSEFPLRQIPVRILPEDIILVAGILASSAQCPEKASFSAFSIASRVSPVRFWIRPSNSSCWPSVY
jgi:hypothetical protein